MEFPLSINHFNQIFIVPVNTRNNSVSYFISDAHILEFELELVAELKIKNHSNGKNKIFPECND